MVDQAMVAVGRATSSIVRSYRRALQLSQEELAARAGVSVRTISGLENPRLQHLPYPETIRLVADALQLSHQEQRALLEALGSSRAARRARRRAPLLSPALALPPSEPDIIGRAEEIQRGCQLLCRPETRILTLVGPPGIGKTRLGLELAAWASTEFGWEAILVDLTPVGEEREALTAIARAAGVSGNGPVRRYRVLRALAARRLLLFLDNFEHVLGAAALLEELVQICPDLKVLVTSREPLRLRRERLLPVPPLALPGSDASTLTLEELAATAAVSLFVSRARLVRPAFQLSAENVSDILAICQRLDGVPLALELAAARLHLLSPRQLLTRLQVGLGVLSRAPAPYYPERHRSWYDAVEWSYRQLDEPERVLFRRLAVFAGGASLEALEMVGGGIEAAERPGRAEAVVLDLLTALSQKNLIVLEESGSPDAPQVRVRLLEPVGDYAALQLRLSQEEEEAQRAHACYFAARCESRDLFVDPLHIVEIEPYEADLENIRAALSWSLHSPHRRDAVLGLRVAGALGPFWYAGGRLFEGQSWLESLLEREPHETDETCSTPFVRARALYMAGWIAMDRGDHLRAEELLGRSVMLHRGSAGEPATLAEVLNRLGNVQLQQEKTLQAQATLTTSLQCGRLAGSPSAVATALNSLATVAACRQRFEQAESLVTRSLALYQSQGAAWGVTFSLARLGDLARWRGDYLAAEKLLRESLALAQVHRDGVIEALALWSLGYMAYEQEKWVEADRWWQARLALTTELGHNYTRAFSLLSLADLKRAQKQYAPAVRNYCEALTAYVGLSVIGGARRGLQGLAEVATVLERPEAARWLSTLGAHWSENIADPPLMAKIMDVADELLTPHV